MTDRGMSLEEFIKILQFDWAATVVAVDTSCVCVYVFLGPFLLQGKGQHWQTNGALQELFQQALFLA